MKILQWSMTIPQNKQEEFVKYFNEVLAPNFQKFGAKKHELLKVLDTQLIGKQTVEKDRFIERVFFDDDFNIPSYFAKVKEIQKHGNYHEVTKRYLELRILSLEF